MDHLALFTKFHDRATTIILIPLLLYLYKWTITYVLYYEDLDWAYAMNAMNKKTPWEDTPVVTGMPMVLH